MTGPLPVVFVGSERHFVEHIAPVWRALPEALRGPVYCGHAAERTTDAVVWGRRHGLPTRAGWPAAHTRGIGVAVAVGDLATARGGAPLLRWVFGEHGCGLTYQGAAASSSYVGSTRRGNVDLIVVPHERAAETQRAATPRIPVLVLGSTPKLDPWAPDGPARAGWQAPPRPVVAVSFHYDLDLVPETRSAASFYAGALGRLRSFGWDVIGHAHPRLWSKIRTTYTRLGIEPVREFDEVLARASVYCVDNSSTLYEFAATGRPVVALNCPLYRRNVHHGLRFWEHVPGLQCDEPAALGSVVEEALADGPAARQLRADAMAHVYPQHDGHAADRFAAALVEAAGGVPILADPPDPRPYKVVDADGGVVRGYAVQSEARRHAAKIGGRVATGLPVAAGSPPG